MIKFEETYVMNIENALRGMRNPLNSWDKSDSWEMSFDDPDGDARGGYWIGENDMALAKKLIAAGSDHRKFLRQIFVSVDITAPIYWWKEFDTYKVGTVANSCSTMHTIHKKEFTLDDFSHEKLCDTALEAMEHVIRVLNIEKENFRIVKDQISWYQLIQLLPSSYNQKRTVTLNYEVLRNIYGSRRNHKLDEWRIGFMSWIESLPYAKELIMI